MCPKSVRYLDGLGLNKAHRELCKLLNVKIELSDDENCVLKLTKKENVERTDFSLKEKKKVGCKMKPYYLAFKDISFKGVKSKVKSNRSLVKKYFHIDRTECPDSILLKHFSSTARPILVTYRYDRNNISKCYEKINSIMQRGYDDFCRKLIPIPDYYWEALSLKNSSADTLQIQRSSDRTIGSSIQVEPKQSLSKFIDEIIPKNTNTFKHSNPRITNKKQLQNYVSEYNNDKGFYEYLSASSNTQS
jgi:hypothetical protein